MDASEDDNGKALILCELAVALVPSLDASGTSILYRVVRPMIRLDTDAHLQVSRSDNEWWWWWLLW